MRLLEPSCGYGAFLIPAVHRLLASMKRRKRKPADLADAIRAIDIDADHVIKSREAVVSALVENDVPPLVARTLAAKWVVQADFLLAEHAWKYDAVVGNPPYVRIEQINPKLQAEYRSRYSAIYDRADLYVAFIQRALDLLSEEGILSYICADRWTMNKYGAPLRKFIADHHRVLTYLDLHQASPFESEVIAYPAIFAIGRGEQKKVRIGKLATGSAEETDVVRSGMKYPATPKESQYVFTQDTWFTGKDPWVIASVEQVTALREMEARLPVIQSGGTKVGIGVASGADEVYIVGADVDIESDRLVPLVKREDIEKGRIKNNGRFVINTFRDDGKCVDLADYPRLAAYLESHPRIKARHVAKAHPRNWFRTIDRVYPELVTRPKLLIPDIAGSNEVVYEEGHFHPHHNLYFVTSTDWDMEVLGGLLSSRVALFFVWSYAVKMRGGWLRFQAQYLRRIRLPRPEDVSKKLAEEIKGAFRARDFKRLDELALKAYGIKRLPDFDFVDTRS